MKEKAIIYIVKLLAKLIGFIEKKFLFKDSNEQALISLAPKVIIDEEELIKINPYLDNLKRAINTKGINNIALTGSYGSGKSTILKTFQHHNRQYEYLNISLASFKDNKKDKEDEFERKLEVSILQQIFYHVKPNIIPDSRFKRIINITKGKLILQTIFVIAWVVSSIILFKFDYINKLNPLSWKLSLKIDWFSILLILIFFAGIGLFVKSVVRLFSNSKISKFNIKGELELGEANDKSVFNQHLEEILYYFERTTFNVVIIEDVDRFNSTDIFTKLREINILINNSNLINRKVSFVYAIKDEMFTDKNERVKFFEFIIPIIPFINPSNAGEQLTKLIKTANLEGVLSSDFTNDVITFIDDIDMRLLINIFHEYQLYSKNLSKDLEQDNLFAMIVYKNMFPDDFGELPKRRGNLYKVLSNRAIYIQGLIKDLNSKIEIIDTEITTIETEVEKPIKELRAVYINRLITNLTHFSSFYIDGNISIIDALEDNYFNKLRESKNIQYSRYKGEYYGKLVIEENIASSLSFSSIEKEISQSLTYSQREKVLINKKNDKVNILKKDKEQLKNKVTEVESFGIKEIFEQVPFEEYLGAFKDNYLIRNLLLNGYINENYNDYISIFHEVNLTKEDFAFERKVKSGLATTYDYQLSKTENLIKRLPDKYFKREVILNYALLDCLIENKEKYSTKVDNIFKLLSIDNENNCQFILNYIERNPRTIRIYIYLLVQYKPSLWSYFKNYSGINDLRLRNILKLIFTYSDEPNINRLKELKSLIYYFEEMVDFVAYASTFGNIHIFKYFINYNSISLKQLDLPNKDSNDIFEYIYDNNLYQINIHNIETIASFYFKDLKLETLNKSHYSTLKNLNLSVLLRYIDENIEVYVENVLLNLRSNKNEDESTIIDLLNNKKINSKLKNKLLELQHNLIKHLKSIKDVEIKELILSNNLLLPTWHNIFDYVDCFEEKDLNKTLISYLNEKENFENLAAYKLNDVKEKDDAYIMKFASNLIYCQDLDFIAYTSLLKSIPYKYNHLTYTKLDNEKIEWMIANKFMTFKIENFTGIKEAFPDLQIKLLEVYESDFVKSVSEFSLDSNDWLLLFKSAIFTQKGKLEIIKNLDDSIIVQNPKIAEIICYLLPIDQYIPFRYEVMFAMFKANPSVPKRVDLLNLHFEKLDDEQIQKLTELLGDDYRKIFMKQHKPTFTKTDYNYTFFNKLRNKKLIIRFEDVDKENEIKVYANY